MTKSKKSEHGNPLNKETACHIDLNCPRQTVSEVYKWMVGDEHGKLTAISWLQGRPENGMETKRLKDKKKNKTKQKQKTSLKTAMPAVRTTPRDFTCKRKH